MPALCDERIEAQSAPRVLTQLPLEEQGLALGVLVPEPDMHLLSGLQRDPVLLAVHIPSHGSWDRLGDWPPEEDDHPTRRALLPSVTPPGFTPLLGTHTRHTAACYQQLLSHMARFSGEGMGPLLSWESGCAVLGSFAFARRVTRGGY